MIQDCLPPSPPAAIESIDGGGGGKEKGVGAGDLSSALLQLSPTGMKPSGTLWGGKGQVFEYLCVLFLSVRGCLSVCSFVGPSLAQVVPRNQWHNTICNSFMP